MACRRPRRRLWPTAPPLWPSRATTATSRSRCGARDSELNYYRCRKQGGGSAVVRGSMKALLCLLLAPALFAAHPPRPRELPLVEVAVPAGTSSDTFVVFVSGDGGWAKIDKYISSVLAAT